MNVLEEFLSTSQISQKEIALKTGLSVACVNQHILGRRKISPVAALKYHKAFGIPLNKLNPTIWKDSESPEHEDDSKSTKPSRFAQKAISILQEYCDKNYAGNIRAMQTSLGMDPEVAYMNRWLKCFKEGEKGGTVPKIDSIGPYLDKVGAVLTGPWDAPATIAQVQTTPSADELSQAKKRIRQLEKEVQELQKYKIKWEAVLELERIRAKSNFSAEGINRGTKG